MFLDAFKNPSKKIEMGTIKEKFEELQQTIYRKKKTGRKQIRLMKFLALFFYFLARIALTLISSPAIISCFRKVNFEKFNLVI